MSYDQSEVSIYKILTACETYHPQSRTLCLDIKASATPEIEGWSRMSNQRTLLIKKKGLTVVEYEAATKDPLQTNVPTVGKYSADLGKFSINERTIDPMQYKIPVHRVPLSTR
jgi:hypothetical protein